MRQFVEILIYELMYIDIWVNISLFFAKINDYSRKTDTDFSLNLGTLTIRKTLLKTIPSLDNTFSRICT